MCSRKKTVWHAGLAVNQLGSYPVGGIELDVVKFELSYVQKKACSTKVCRACLAYIGSDYLKDSVLLKCGLVNFSFVSFRKKKWFYVVWHIGSDYLRRVAKCGKTVSCKLFLCGAEECVVACRFGILGLITICNSQHPGTPARTLPYAHHYYASG